MSQDVTSQGECQTKCEAESGCVGISYSHKEEDIEEYRYENTRYCYVCLDDILDSAGSDFGFYRRPSGKKKLSVKKVEAFSQNYKYYSPYK